MGAAETFQARGAGGAVFTFDVPAAGSREEELLVEQFRRGDLVVLDDDGNDVPFVELEDEAPPEVVKVPEQRQRKASATKKSRGRKSPATPRVDRASEGDSEGAHEDGDGPSGPDED